MCSLTDLTPPSCLSSIKVWFKPLILLKNWTCKIYELALQIYWIFFQTWVDLMPKILFFMLTDFLKALINVDEIFRWSFQFLIRFIQKDEKYICNKTGVTLGLGAYYLDKYVNHLPRNNHIRVVLEDAVSNVKLCPN